MHAAEHHGGSALLVMAGGLTRSCIASIKNQACYSELEKPMEQITEQLKQIIISGLRIKDRTAADLTDETELLGGELEIDSIDILQLILEIERQFKIELVEGELDQSAWRTIGTLAASVQAKIAQQ
jgi:acyl carrier protein